MSRATVAALLAALALTGCFGGDDDEPDRAGSGTPTATPAAGEPEATATATATPDADATEPLAEQTVRVRGQDGTTLDIAVLGLEAEGRLATLTLEYTLHGPEATEDPTLFDLAGGNTLIVTLLDAVNLKRHYVVEDTSGASLEPHSSRTRLAPETPTTGEYTFAAPPDDVTEVDVAVGDWPIFRDVPIAR